MWRVGSEVEAVYPLRVQPRGGSPNGVRDVAAEGEGPCELADGCDQHCLAQGQPGVICGGCWVRAIVPGAGRSKARTSGRPQTSRKRWLRCKR